LASWQSGFFAEDPNTSLFKRRQFAETLLKEVAARTGSYRPDMREQFIDLLQRLQSERVIPREVSDVFHAIRNRGNVAVHDLVGDYNEALSCLKFARALGIWFYQTFGRDPGFKPSPFVPPCDPRRESHQLAEKLEALRQRVLEAEAKAATAHATAAEQARARAAAEEMAQREREDRQVWKELAHEQEAAQARLGEELAKLQAAARSAPDQETVSLIQAGRDAATKLELDEADTRRLIDVQLNEMGWEADSQELRYAKGARPEEGRNRAIAEWPTESGPVDYALFIGETCVGVIEAKRQAVDVPPVLEQAKRYARTIRLKPENLCQNALWQHGLDEPYWVPYVCATNGRPFVRQWITKSGIWHWDARQEVNHATALPAWFSPEDLKTKLEQDTGAAHMGLAEEAFGYGGLRPYQEEAIRAVEQAAEAGQRDILISMATGTGKTRTCIALMYRLLKHKRFRRILFLVERTALGDQTTDALETTELEGFYKFSQIDKVAGLDQRLPEPEDQVQVATVQAMVSRILNEPDSPKRPTPGTYDCIIVDEAHRGYTLDAELRESDIGFRNIEDYQSAYRQVLDYFDAVKIGLTATPALQTREIFGHPVYRYGYRQAVVEGYLIDHLPPKRITTALAEAGIHFEGGEEVEIVDPRTGQIDPFELPDDVSLDYDLAAFNKRVYSENFNRVVCEAIAAEIPPDRPGKTLIFAGRDSHADDVVRLLTKALEEEYGPIPSGMVQKITGSVPGNKDLIQYIKRNMTFHFAAGQSSAVQGRGALLG
jgi:type I restriction enzyme, R subunit